MTSIQLRVNPTNAALAYKGYELNDLANALGLKAELTVDYTEMLGEIDGFESAKFDDLPNHYTNSGEEKRGYELSITEVTASDDESVAAFDENAALSGALVYAANPTLQFNDFTKDTKQLQATAGVFVSEAYATAHELAEGDKVVVEAANATLETTLSIDSKMGGEMPFVASFDSNLNSGALFDGYRFASATLKKV